ncbi:lysophospholipid acyltransferase family protein [Loktanella sp. TSTF-M6]|uniref:Lysophospholipid acyltransferase family protein n=1 Tax=Loktanella gaetbuli TaxID=2881335 RepID=A0ABS8BT41_9RHOB|nr:lysophospholipid acyltransferase family protein [Loktanella gaetbuli]MCB5198893.1 lysophospholipid acyltransferase family protein [Loktanella gaetbuli]
MTEAVPDQPRRSDTVAYDRRALSYAASFDSPARRAFVRGVEWLTGKLVVLRMVRTFERMGPVTGLGFWQAALQAQGITITTQAEQIARIPDSGPVVLVANHPHGMVDGMALAALIGQRRDDFRILSRSLLAGLDAEAARYMIPVPFPDHPDAHLDMIAMRRAAMAHLADGGLIALFPAGGVATSDSLLGPAIEAEWKVFTAKMIRLSGATVVPCYFPGANSRAYQIANRISPLLRQSLLLHEIVRLRNTAMAPVIGAPIPFAQLAPRLGDPRSLMSWLRAQTLALGQRVGTGTSPR